MLLLVGLSGILQYGKRRRNKATIFYLTRYFGFSNTITQTAVAVSIAMIVDQTALDEVRYPLNSYSKIATVTLHRKLTLPT